MVVKNFNKVKTTEDFIQKSIYIHGDRYDYSKVQYVNSVTKVSISCIEHGEYLQRPGKHLAGSGCPKCGRIRTTEKKTHSNDWFIGKAKSKHGDIYNYSKSEYITLDSKLVITCPEHGDFLQTPDNHLRGSGCPECGNIKISESRITNSKLKRRWDFTQPEEYKLIPLSQGKFAKVDNEDFDRLKDINWWCTAYGYAKNKTVGLMHRYIIGAPPELHVDHINQDTSDNRRSNLRLATHQKNMFNRKPKKGSSSIYKGVSWINHIKKWAGEIAHAGVRYRLGYFVDEIECAKEYDRKALELFGDFAYLNFPELKREYLNNLKTV